MDRISCSDTCVFVEGMRLSCRVGVGDEERSAAQTVLVNFACALKPSDIVDDVSDTVNYADLVKKIRGIVGERRLLETLALEIAAVCFQSHRVVSVSVTLRKMNILSEVDAVGVTRVFKIEPTAK